MYSFHPRSGTNFTVSVYLDKKYVGEIHQDANGAFYFKPIGSNDCGKKYLTLSACKESLQS